MAQRRIRVRPETTYASQWALTTFNPALEYVESSGYYYMTIEDGGENVVNFTITANNGYSFPRAPVATLMANYSTLVSNKESTLSSNDTVATFNFTYTLYGSNYPANLIFSTFEVVQNTPTPTGQTTFVTYYNVTNDILSELSKTLFRTITTEQYIEEIDLSQYISSIRFYPFEIASSDPIDIILGNYNLSIKAPVANTIYHEIDFGSVTLSSTNHNSNDFNAIIKILLPYIGQQALNATLYANQEINLRYNVNISTGMTIATLYVEGIPIDIFTGVLGREIPYHINQIYNANSLIDTTIQDTYPLEATIFVAYHDNLNTEYVSNNALTLSTISDNSDNGFCSFSNIQLSSAIPEILQNEIIQLLTSGIIM